MVVRGEAILRPFQQASGQIFKDDVNGFSYILYNYFMVRVVRGIIRSEGVLPDTLLPCSTNILYENDMFLTCVYRNV